MARCRRSCWQSSGRAPRPGDPAAAAALIVDLDHAGAGGGELVVGQAKNFFARSERVMPIAARPHHQVDQAVVAHFKEPFHASTHPRWVAPTSPTTNSRRFMPAPDQGD